MDHAFALSQRSQDRFDKPKGFTNRFDSIGDYIAKRLNDPNGKWRYYVIAKSLDLDLIEKLIRLSLRKGRNPGAYFNYLATKETASLPGRASSASEEALS